MSMGKIEDKSTGVRGIVIRSACRWMIRNTVVMMIELLSIPYGGWMGCFINKDMDPWDTPNQNRKNGHP
jgi:hypothetical protein